MVGEQDFELPQWVCFTGEEVSRLLLDLRQFAFGLPADPPLRVSVIGMGQLVLDVLARSGMEG